MIHIRGPQCIIHLQIYIISHTLVDKKIVDYPDVVGASPTDDAPTTSSLSTWHLASMDWAEPTAREDDKHLSIGIWCGLN